MSFDFAVGQLCTHEVVREISIIDPETHTQASFQVPPANRNVKVEIDGVQVPQSGLYSKASLPFSKSDPYRIHSGISDLLYIKLGFDPPTTIPLISGSAIRASDIASDLQRKLPSLSVSVQNKHVVLSSRSPGLGTAFSFPDPRWTDKTSSLPSTSRILSTFRQLGIVPGRSVTGVKIFPSWSIVLDPFSPDGTGRILQFDSPILNHDPIIQLSYVTDAPNCRRCFGSRFEYDYSILNGTYETVRDTDLLAQEFDKFVFTRLGSHWKWNWMGSGLVDRIGGKSTAGAVTANAMINVDISNAFRTYQSIKSQQDSRFPTQRVSDAEYPAKLAGINVRTASDDPTIAIVTTTIVSRSQVAVPLKRVIGNPSPFTFGDGSSPFRLRG